MEKADFYLFEKLYKDKPLFGSQTELVLSLLNNINSSFYNPDSQSDDYKRDLNRLKAYISQLLSDSVARTLTPIFKNSLNILISERLKQTEYNAGEIYSKIVSLLEEGNKKAVTTVSDLPVNAIRELFSSISQSSDVLVITARPFDIVTNGIKYTLQQFLLLDFVSQLLQPEGKLKRYRFNFPIKQIGDLFWIGLKKALDQYLFKELSSKKYIESIYLKSLIQKDLYEELIQTEAYGKDTVYRTSASIIRFLNTNSFIVVYIVDAPIYSVPMMILQPNQKTTAAYTILEDDFGATTVTKLGKEDTVVWKFLVWDRIKARKMGEPFEFNIPI